MTFYGEIIDGSVAVWHKLFKWKCHYWNSIQFRWWCNRRNTRCIHSDQTRSDQIVFFFFLVFSRKSKSFFRKVINLIGEFFFSSIHTNCVDIPYRCYSITRKNHQKILNLKFGFLSPISISNRMDFSLHQRHLLN